MQGIKRRLVFNYGIILFLAVFVLELVFIISVRQYYYESIGQTVQGRATASAAFYNKYLAYDPLRDKARYIFENTSGEDKVMIEVIDLQGKVISSSSGVITGAKAITPDMKKAREGVTGRWTGRDKATGEKILAVSTPLKYDQRTISGILRYSTSLGFADKQITRLALVALLLGFMVIALSLLLSIMLARSIINPVQELTKTAKKLAEGNYRVKAVKRNDDEIGELAETFNYMADEITKSDRVKNEFISSISHELRTPLTSIKGWSETILDGELEDKEEALQGLKIIVRETDRLTGLVEELLDFSKFEAGRVRLVTARVNINGLIEEVCQQFRLRAIKKDISIQTELCPELPEIHGDKNRLKQVLINVLDNALKFTPDGGVIRITSAGEIESVKMEVIDTGHGILAEDLPRVSEKFFQGNGAVAGSGLGLSICSEIIKLHNGQMQINSQLGAGTRVVVKLPFYMQ
ncbi:MAG: HAMP domain-containing sensor histidine kinase [Syntrophomonadaceae bacterium]|nr:HAMP domain-containing sensor histidine kinase [Syntrophomonadaceae bacterium]MDD4548451.1 HAMP domain-containing sensor histidine kinase [Syntrophomonadaceae bacterium]